MVKRKTWQQPWGYAESFFIVFGLFIAGLILEIVTNPKHILLPGWPYNFYISVSYIATLILLHHYFNENIIVRWLSNVPASVGAITFYTLASLLMGILPQDKDSGGLISLFGFTNLLNSWYFVFATIYLLTCLGFVILRRLKNFNRRNLGFLANHFGLWLVIFAASIGSGDLTKYQVVLEKGKISNMGYLNETKYVRLPFNIKLVDFSIDEFPAKLALVDKRTGAIDNQLKNNMFLIKNGIEKQIDNYKIKILNYFPSTDFDSIKKFKPANDSGVIPAALISAINVENGSKIEGWITCGNSTVMPIFLDLKNNYAVTMTSPEAKSYKSVIEITSHKSCNIKALLEVNKPFSYKGWKLYQVSYDKEMGKFSKTSIIEIIKDPWLPLVYTGFFLLIAGALYLFWIGKNKR